MKSSYRQNNYGLLFEALASIHKPNLIVECGVLNGYSLLYLARGARSARVVGIDLFEDYEFKHGDAHDIADAAYREGLFVELWKQDALQAAAEFEDESVGILHIDISNDGLTLPITFGGWFPKVKKDGIIIFEGGSEERDNVEWMKKYEKRPIREFKENWRDLKERCEFVTLVPFPSLTIVRKIK